MNGAIKSGHLPGETSFGYMRENKRTVINPATAPIVKVNKQLITKKHSLI